MGLSGELRPRRAQHTGECLLGCLPYSEGMEMPTEVMASLKAHGKEMTVIGFKSFSRECSDGPH